MLTFYLRLTESRKFIIARKIKQWLDVHEVVLYLGVARHLLYIHFCVGFDIAYPRAIGNARALVSGIGKSADSHAFSFMYHGFIVISIRHRESAERKRIGNLIN